MTDHSMINYYRRIGRTQREISAILGVPESTIKTYCWRHPDTDDICLMCGTKMSHTTGKKKKRFCTDKCRLSWWKNHPEMMSLKKGETTCAYCGKTFESYGSSKRRFCSRKCYVDSTRKEARNDG